MRARRRRFMARTRRALLELDAVAPLFETIECDADLERAVAARDAAIAAVGVAFAEDTADRNDREVAMRTPTYPAGLAFVRRVAALEKAT